MSKGWVEKKKWTDTRSSSILDRPFESAKSSIGQIDRADLVFRIHTHNPGVRVLNPITATLSTRNLLYFLNISK